MNKLNIPNLSVLKGGIDLADENARGKNGLALPPDLAAHPAFSKVFRQGRMSFGLIAPFKGYPAELPENIDDLGETAQLAEKLGFDTLWVRDVPFFDPHFGDAGQGFDPMVTLGYLAAKTEKIAIGTAGFVAPLRSPIHIAKTAVSTDRLSGSRFLLGMSSGDRPVEYPIFQENFENRAERFSESVSMIRALTEQNFPLWRGKYYGSLNGNVDLLPKPNRRLPIVTVGRARQELKWLATESDAWIWYAADKHKAKQMVDTLADLGDGKTWKPFGTAGFVELLEDQNAPAELFNGVYLRGGAHSIAEFWDGLRESGVTHVAINLKPTKRPADETLQDLAENVLAKLNK